MQTFLPYPSFFESAKCLDMRRLGKQRIEARQILDTLETRRNYPNSSFAWKNHPAVIMWEGYENALKLYFNTIVQEWIDRGYKNSLPFYTIGEKILFPQWVGFSPFHDSHKSNLLRKNPEHYSQFNWDISDDLPYIWPPKLFPPKEVVLSNGDKVIDFSLYDFGHKKVISDRPKDWFINGHGQIEPKPIIPRPLGIKRMGEKTNE